MNFPYPAQPRKIGAWLINFVVYLDYLLAFFLGLCVGMECAVAQSVEHATPGEEVVGSIPAVAALSLMVGSVSVVCDRLRQKPWPFYSVSCVTARKIIRSQSWDSSVMKPSC